MSSFSAFRLGLPETGSFLVTGSVNANVVTLTKGDGSSFDLTIDTGSTSFFDTSSLIVTASAVSNVITFEKGDGSVFNVTIDTGSGGGGIVDTSSLLVTASLSGSSENTIEFEKGDGSTFDITIDTGSTPSWEDTLNVDNQATLTGQGITSLISDSPIFFSQISGSDLAQIDIQPAISQIARNLNGDNSSGLSMSGLTNQTILSHATASNSGSALVLQPNSIQLRLTRLPSTNVLAMEFDLEAISEYTTASFYMSNHDLDFRGGTIGQVLTRTANGAEWQNTGSGGSGGSVDTSSLMVTGSVSGNTLTFQKGNGDTFDLVVDTGSGGIGGSVDTSSLLVTASAASNVITFEKGNGDTFDVTVDTGSASALAGSGLSAAGSTINLGGELTQNTTIDLSGSFLYIDGDGDYRTRITTAGVINQVSVGPAGGGFYFDYGNAGNQVLNFNESLGIRIVDTQNNQGIKYESDYSANYTLRSLVDKEYVDSAISVSGSVQNLAQVLATANSSSGNDLVISNNDAIDFKADNVSIMIFSGSEDIAYGNGVLNFRDFETLAFSSGSGASEQYLIRLRQISPSLADVVIGSPIVDGEISIFQNGNYLTIQSENLTDTRSIVLGDFDVYMTGAADLQYLGYDQALNRFEPKTLPSAIDTSSFVKSNQTSSFVRNEVTQSFVTNDQTSSFLSNSATASFVTVDQTSSFVSNSQTSSFVTSEQTSSFLTVDDTPVLTGSLLVTASAALNVLTFEKGDGSTFNVTVDTGSSTTPIDTSSFVTNDQTSSFVTNDQTSSFLTPADTASFLVASDIENLVTPDITASVLVTASYSGNVLTFDKGDGSTFDITLNTGSVTDTDLTPLNEFSSSILNFTASYFVDSASFQSRIGTNESDISDLQSWSSSLVIPDAIDTSSFVTNDQTASFVTNSETASFVTNDQTSSFITADQTSSFLTPDDTGSFLVANDIAGLVTADITASSVVTASVSNNTITFEKGNGDTFDITVDTGSGGGGGGGSTDTSSLLVTASAAGATITFTKGDSSTFDVTVSGGGIVDTGSLLETASFSATESILTVTKGDNSAFTIQLNKPKAKNVLDYGAMNDGVGYNVSAWLVGGALDRGYADLAAIQVDYPEVENLGDDANYHAMRRAIDETPTGSTAYIRFPAGRYRTGNQNGFFIRRDNVIVEGDGWGTVLEQTKSTNDALKFSGYRTDGWDQRPISMSTFVESSASIGCKFIYARSQTEADRLSDHVGRPIFISAGASRYDQFQGEFNFIESITGSLINLRYNLSDDYTLERSNWAGEISASFTAPAYSSSVNVLITGSLPVVNRTISVGNDLYYVSSNPAPNEYVLVSESPSNASGVSIPIGTKVFKYRAIVKCQGTYNNIRVRDLALESPGDVVNTSNCIDVRLQNVKGTKIFPNGSGLWLDADDGRDIELNQCKFYADVPISSQPARSVTDFRVVDSDFFNCGFDFSEFARKCSVKDSRFYLKRNYGGVDFAAINFGWTTADMVADGNELYIDSMSVAMGTKSDINFYKGSRRGKISYTNNKIVCKDVVTAILATQGGRMLVAENDIEGDVSNIITANAAELTASDPSGLTRVNGDFTSGANCKVIHNTFYGSCDGVMGDRLLNAEYQWNYFHQTGFFQGKGGGSKQSNGNIIFDSSPLTRSVDRVVFSNNTFKNWRYNNNSFNFNQPLNEKVSIRNNRFIDADVANAVGDTRIDTNFVITLNDEESLLTGKTDYYASIGAPEVDLALFLEWVQSKDGTISSTEQENLLQFYKDLRDNNLRDKMQVLYHSFESFNGTKVPILGWELTQYKQIPASSSYSEDNYTASLGWVGDGSSVEIPVVNAQEIDLSNLGIFAQVTSGSNTNSNQNILGGYGGNASFGYRLYRDTSNTLFGLGNATITTGLTSHEIGFYYSGQTGNVTQSNFIELETKGRVSNATAGTNLSTTYSDEMFVLSQGNANFSEAAVCTFGFTNYLTQDEAEVLKNIVGKLAVNSGFPAQSASFASPTVATVVRSLSQSEYDNLVSPDDNILYVIT